MVRLFAGNLSAVHFAVFGSAGASVSVQRVNLARMSSHNSVRSSLAAMVLALPLSAGDDNSPGQGVALQGAPDKRAGMTVGVYVG